MSAKDKSRRYRNLIQHFRNWPQYLWFKASNLGDVFSFKLRESFSVEVEREMLSAFKECFFDQIYLKHIPNRFLQFKSPTIIDIGANVGFFSLFMFYLYPKAKLLSFEPMPFNFQVLEKYQTKYADFDWHIEQKAISSEDQKITLHVSKIDSYTTMATIFESSNTTKNLEVEAVSLQQVIRGHAIEGIDILKLDCEGSEYSILYSLPPDTIKKIKVLIVETHEGNKPEETNKELVKFLQNSGFRLYSQPDGYTGYIWGWKDIR
ncbi:MAG: FkbM family methyltransferase [Cyclobacteriaceae bacterium]